jgi:hypothetical protein
MLFDAPALAQLPPGLPWLASTQCSPATGLGTLTEEPARRAAVRDASPRRARTAVEHWTPFATTIQECPAALTIPQLEAACAGTARTVAVRSESVAANATMATRVPMLDPIIRKPPRLSFLTAADPSA